MMNVFVDKSELKGNIRAITSKSYVHRALICAALSNKVTEIRIDDFSIDIITTMDCLRQLGSEVIHEGHYVTVHPIKKLTGIPELNCKESGSTLRFILPVACALYDKVRIKGEGRLPNRPLVELMDTMKEHGVEFSAEKLPLETTGKMNAKGTFKLPGDVSSQYISGILLAAPLLEDEVTIEITTKLESTNYMALTMEVMQKYGVDIEWNKNIIKCSGKYHQNFTEIPVESDWSNGTVFLCAGALGNDIVVKGLNINSLQPDRASLEILKGFGADVSVSNEGVSVKSKELKATVIDLSEQPDLLPVMSVIAAVSEGTTQFVNCKRLRLKESDRIASTAKMINDLGGVAVEEDEALIVHGVKKLHGGMVDSFGDHRIVMAATLASGVCDEKVMIVGAEAVNKSYPHFFEDFALLGGNVCRQ